MNLDTVRNASGRLVPLTRRCENLTEKNRTREQSRQIRFRAVPGFKSNFMNLQRNWLTDREQDEKLGTRMVLHQCSGHQGDSMKAGKSQSKIYARHSSLRQRVPESIEICHEKLIVIGKKPDLRYDDGLYFRVKISDLTQRSINGNCQVHGRYAEAHSFCGDSNATCLGCLTIAKDVLDIYNEQKTVSSKLLRRRLPLCTCNIVVTNSGNFLKGKGRNENQIVAMYSAGKRQKKSCTCRENDRIW